MEEIKFAIKNMINEVSGLEQDELEDDVNLFSFGLDSLMLVQVKKKIDNYYNIELPVERLMSDVDTIEKVAEYISKENMPSFPKTKVNVSNTYASNSELEKICEQIYPLAQQKEFATDDEYKKSEENTFIQSELNAFMETQLNTVAQTLKEITAQQLSIFSKEQKKSVKVEKTPKKRPQINFRAVKLERDIFTEQQKRFLQQFIKRYNEKTQKSKEYAQTNRKQFSDWIASLNFRMDFKELIYPIVSAKSQGARFWDIDGNEYIDMAIGYGVHFFGHRPEFIVDALKAQIEEGYETGPQTDLGGEVASLICEITGVERVAFANTGSEAVMAALRIARTVTKKNKVIMFKGSYHGNFDCVLAETAEDGTFPISPGTMPGMVEDVLVLDYATPESLKTIEDLKDEVAAVIVEPVQSRNPSLQPKEYLQKLKKLTKEIGAALIFDEMITGFRIAPGGVQEYFGIEADLVTYGKIVGGGMPIGIVAGKAEYIDAVDGGFWGYGDSSFPEKEMTYFAGTFCKHPLSLAASRAVLQYIKKDQGQTQKRVNKLTDYFVEKVNQYFYENEVPMIVHNFASEFRFETNGKFDLAKLSAQIDILFYLLMEKGIYIWEKRTCFFSAVHTVEDADYFLQAIKDCITEMRENGFEFRSLQDKGSK